MKSHDDRTHLRSQNGILKINDVLDSKAEAMVAEYAAKKGVSFDDALQELIMLGLEGVDRPSDPDAVTLSRAEYEALKLLAKAGMDAMDE